MSFYVVSVKDRIQESTGNIMYPLRTATKRSLMRLETLRATDPKADLGPICKNMTLCSHYMLEKDLLAARHCGSN
jgi:hypothetical protein